MQMSAILRISVFIFIIMLAVIPGVLAWDDCPRGLVNDPYPGVCNRYVDTNNDGICDHSQAAPVAMVTTDPASRETPVPATVTIIMTNAPGSAAMAPAATQKAPLNPVPALLAAVLTGMYLFRKGE